MYLILEAYNEFNKQTWLFSRSRADVRIKLYNIETKEITQLMYRADINLARECFGFDGEYLYVVSLGDYYILRSLKFGGMYSIPPEKVYRDVNIPAKVLQSSISVTQSNPTFTQYSNDSDVHTMMRYIRRHWNDDSFMRLKRNTLVVFTQCGVYFYMSKYKITDEKSLAKGVLMG